jgi:hypothetical protein
MGLTFMAIKESLQVHHGARLVVPDTQFRGGHFERIFYAHPRDRS